MPGFLQIALVALGGALGSLLRWGVSATIERLAGHHFPWSTFLVNISGCLFLGWLSTYLAKHIVDDGEAWLRAHDWHLFLAMGFTGAYTTFSTFERESVNLFDQGHGWLAALYVSGSVFVGLMAIRLGAMMAGK